MVRWVNEQQGTCTETASGVAEYLANLNTKSTQGTYAETVEKLQSMRMNTYEQRSNLEMPEVRKGDRFTL